jgi:hypothetical protein
MFNALDCSHISSWPLQINPKDGIPNPPNRNAGTCSKKPSKPGCTAFVTCSPCNPSSMPPPCPGGACSLLLISNESCRIKGKTLKMRTFSFRFVPRPSRGKNNRNCLGTTVQVKPRTRTSLDQKRSRTTVSSQLRFQSP